LETAIGPDWQSGDPIRRVAAPWGDAVGDTLALCCPLERISVGCRIALVGADGQPRPV
jgi:hypothetical protein